MRYFIWYKLQKIYRRFFKGEVTDDDFNWSLYHHHYHQELINIAKEYRLILKPGDYKFTKGKLKRNVSGLDLLGIHELLYETLMQLEPKSVMELGCGWGDHLHNLSILLPKTEISGVDVGMGQLKNLRKRHKKLRATTMQYDMTLPYSNKLPKVDILYVQAVIMHIQTQNNYIVALANAFHCAKNQVVMTENWARHDYKKLITTMHKKGMISWPNVYLYYRKGRQNSSILIASRTKLKYKELKNYRSLPPPHEQTDNTYGENALDICLRRV